MIRVFPATAVVVCLLGPAVAFGETVVVDGGSTTSAELPGVVAKALGRLAGRPGESHELVLRGEFRPVSTVRISWWGAGRLTVSGTAVLDGTGLPEDAETVFVAGRNVTLDGLRFENSRGHAVVVGGKSDGYAIRNCTFEDCRKSAIHVWNDPHAVLRTTKRRGRIDGNRITRFNLEKAKWANDGITVFDQRVTISRNAVSDSPTETNGIRAMGRDLVVERNVVRGVSRDDSGGIYLWGGPHASLFRGNVVRWNHVVGASRGIYLDDGTSEAVVEENVVENSAVCAIFLSGGRDNRVERNVVDRTPVFVHLDSRCLGWDSRPEYAELAQKSVSRLRAALATPEGGLLRERHPGLRELTENDLTLETYGRPLGNRVAGNFARATENTWELMDFSAEVETDFRAINELATPRSYGSEVGLGRADLRERFGFRGWGRLDEAGPASVEASVPERSRLPQGGRVPPVEE